MDLSKIRQDIDKIDDQIAQLLEQRMDLVSQVVAYKRSTGKLVLDSKREEEILKKVANKVDNKVFEETIVATFSDILARSRQFQEEHLS